MSRVGLVPIEVPSGVTVKFDLPSVTVKGPKGELKRKIPVVCDIDQDGSTIKVTRKSDDRLHRSMHGLTRTLIHNMIIGVSDGFSKELEIVGVGYKAEVKGKNLELNLGFSHPIKFVAPEGIAFETPEPTKVKVSGMNKETVGQIAAEIRKLRPPEPYKGKGVKYVGEHIQRKAGKTAAGSGG